MANINLGYGITMINGDDEGYDSKSEAEFMRLCAKVNEFGFGINARSNKLDIAFNEAISEVMINAENNAVDTFKETGRTMQTLGYESRTKAENEEFWRIALGSICCTSPFDTSIIVREWFKGIGYKW